MKIEQYVAVTKKKDPSDGEPAMPVSYINWSEAQDFCKMLSQTQKIKARLPTEAEWEYACRAGSTTLFNVGDELDEKSANVSSAMKPSGGRKPVGSYKPNAWGLFDMHGNVFEWCQDWCDASYYKNSPASDPQGSETGTKRTLRGGAYHGLPYMARSTTRQPIAPDVRNDIYGFRLAVSLENP